MVIAGIEAWLAAIADSERRDPIWRMEGYRLARYAGDAVRTDLALLRSGAVSFGLSDQLHRAVISIAANLAEGYSRSSGADRVRFFEYALGSTREAIVWYDAVRHILPDDVAAARKQTLTSIRAILLAAIPRERNRRIARGEG